MRAAPQKLTGFFGAARGFSFAREIQPILDRHCVRCHTGRKPKPFSLSGETVAVGKTRRRFSRAYLALTHTRGTEGDCNHPVVNWIDSMSEPEPLGPYHRGAAKSKLPAMLAKGHNKVRLSPEELARIACWIDLLVPFAGDYREHHAWDKQEQARYDRFEAKRRRAEAQERAAIQASIGRPDAPAVGPRKE